MYKSANEETHATVGYGKNAMCPNWSVYTWGKKWENEHANKIENIYFIPIALAAPHRSAHTVYPSNGEEVETKRKLDCVMDNVYVWWVFYKKSKKLKREKPTRKCANQIEIHNCIRISLQLATKRVYEIQILWSRIHTKRAYDVSVG